MESFLKNLEKYKVIVCAGTGGVGKTSISAALGLKFAEQGKKVLVLTVDPAKRLKTALGLTDLGIEDTVRVESFSAKNSFLDAGVVNAKLVFDDFVKRNSPDEQSAKTLLDNLLYQKLSMGLQGSQEFTSLERFYTAYEDNQYDLVIVDTPPSQHAIDFLEGPTRLKRLFDESILKWFVSEKDSRFKFVGKIISTGTRKAFGLLERLTGKQFVDEIFNFFVSMKALQKTLVQRTEQINQLLKSEKVGFVLVTAYDEKKIAQAIEFYKRLNSSGFHFSGLITNRCFPGESEMVVHQASEEKNKYFFALQSYYKGEEAALAEIHGQMQEHIPSIKIYEQTGAKEPVDLIRSISEQLG